MITLEQAKNYMRIDYTEDDVFIGKLIEASLIYIDSMVGEAYKLDEKAVKLAELLQLKLTSDMYDNRSGQVPTNVKNDVICTSILDKLSNYIIEDITE